MGFPGLLPGALLSGAPSCLGVWGSGAGDALGLDPCLALPTPGLEPCPGIFSHLSFESPFLKQGGQERTQEAAPGDLSLCPGSPPCSACMCMGAYLWGSWPWSPWPLLSYPSWDFLTSLNLGLSPWPAAWRKVCVLTGYYFT